MLVSLAPGISECTIAIAIKQLCQAILIGITNAGLLLSARLLRLLGNERSAGLGRLRPGGFAAGRITPDGPTHSPKMTLSG